MNYAKQKYKVIIQNDGMFFLRYGETLDEINMKIDQTAKENRKPLKVEIYRNNDIQRNPHLTDWTLIKTMVVE